MIVERWTDVAVTSLQDLWLGVVHFIPNLIGAVVLIIIGLLVATGLGALVQKILEAVRLDAGLSKLGISPFVERAGLKLRASYFFGRLVYWFMVIVFLLAAADALGLFALSAFLQQVLFYIPNIVAAVLIMLASFVIANFLRRLVLASVSSAQLAGSGFLGTLTWWTVMIFGFFAALIQLNVAVAILQTLITGFIAMLALAGGLAFGLGGRDYASELIRRLREHTEGRR